jgi:hypothetical protein
LGQENSYHIFKKEPIRVKSLIDLEKKHEDFFAL